jgi:cytochrome c peroxidase
LVRALPFEVPAHFPAPRIPDNNFPTAARVALGEQLFFDTRMSANQTASCGSCHFRRLAFADGKAKPTGSTGDVVPRNSMALANVAWFSSLTWANPLLDTLEGQALVPLFADHPDAIELGITNAVPEVEARFRADDDMVALFADAFGDADAPSNDDVTIGNMVLAIASYERSLVSGDSRYDRYAYGGDSDAISDEEKLGLVLFNSERAECYHCHGGVFFTTATVAENSVVTESGFENNGLYDVDADDVDPQHLGLASITNAPRDRGRFRVPSLRNVELTAPYMHDGSLVTLEDVVAHYVRGGVRSQRQNPLVKPLDLDEREQAALVAFLKSLTDEAFVAVPSTCDAPACVDAADDE